jgi:hypothetical protein
MPPNAPGRSGISNFVIGRFKQGSPNAGTNKKAKIQKRNSSNQIENVS